jgi:hypothetical protein
VYKKEKETQNHNCKHNITKYLQVFEYVDTIYKKYMYMERNKRQTQTQSN